MQSLVLYEYLNQHLAELIGQSVYVLHGVPRYGRFHEHSAIVLCQSAGDPRGLSPWHQAADERLQARIGTVERGRVHPVDHQLYVVDQRGGPRDPCPLPTAKHQRPLRGDGGPMAAETAKGAAAEIKAARGLSI